MPRSKRTCPTSRLADVYRSNPTKAEARFERTLKKLEPHGYKFLREIALGPYIADFYCAQKWLIIELDGWIHRQSRQRRHDGVRDEYFRSRGIRTIRIPSRLALMEPGAAMRALKNALGIAENTPVEKSAPVTAPPIPPESQGGEPPW